MSRRQLAARENLMYDVRVCDISVLDSRVRAWLKRVPLLAIVVLLEAIDDELRWPPFGLRHGGATFTNCSPFVKEQIYA